MPYLWRRLSESQRKEVLLWRQQLKRPWHRPPHFDQGSVHYHLTAACYEHQPWIGQSPERMSAFSGNLLTAIHDHPESEPPTAWCVLPNHYHVLVRTTNLKGLIAELSKLHGRISFQWNREEQTPGRKVWHGTADRAMRGEDHFWATMNYIHHNPVKHGYADRWDEWDWSSARDYLESVGRDEAIRIWKGYPLMDYGKGWDD